MRALRIALLLGLLCRAAAFAACGDGVLDLGEQCDDGNLIDGDCCSSTCQLETTDTVCRAAAGPCDVEEHCTGVDPGCHPT